MASVFVLGVTKLGFIRFNGVPNGDSWNTKFKLLQLEVRIRITKPCLILGCNAIVGAGWLYFLLRQIKLVYPSVRSSRFYTTILQTKIVVICGESEFLGNISISVLWIETLFMSRPLLLHSHLFPEMATTGHIWLF